MWNDQRRTELTNHGDADSSIVSCANFVDRNTGVHSICINSDVEHTWATVANKRVIKIELIHMGCWVGICNTI